MSQPEYGQPPRIKYPVRCEKCGRECYLPAKPGPGTKVLCEECYKEKKERGYAVIAESGR